MTPLEGFSVGPTTLLYLLNLAVAVSGVCAIGLISVILLRRGSAPVRHALLLSALVLVVFSPALVWLARQTGSGVVRIAARESAARNDARPELPAMPENLPSAIDSLPLDGASAPDVQTATDDSSTPTPDADNRTATGGSTQPKMTTAPSPGEGRLELALAPGARRETKPTPGESVASSPRNGSTGAHGSVPWLTLFGSAMAGIWAAGIAVGLAQLSLGMTRLARLRRSLKKPAASYFEHAAAEAAERTGLREAPAVYVSPFVPTPISMGLLHPVIVLPEGFEQQVSETQLGAILLHETAHLARGDGWVGLLERLVAILHWWNPLIARLNSRLRALREEICDNYVLQSPGKGHLYAEALVEMAARVSAATRLPITVGILDSKLDGLDGRVNRLVNHRGEGTTTIRLNRASKSGVLAFGLALAAVLMISNVRADKPPQESQRAAEELRREVEARQQVAENPEPAAKDRERAAANLPESAQSEAATDEDAILALLEVAESLPKLGPYADMPTAAYDQPAPAAFFGSMAQRLLRLPVEQRYQLLRRWTLPTDDRQTVRLLASFVPTDGPPPEFEAVDFRRLAVKGVLSSSDLLIESARNAGKLDELGDDLLEAADAGVPNAEAFSILVEIARGNGAEVREEIEQNLTALPSKLADSNRENRFQPMEWTDLLVARACLNDPALKSLGENYARTLARYPQKWSTLNDSFVSHVVQDLLDASYNGNRASGDGWDPGLALWRPVNELNSIAHRIGRVPSYWYAQNGEIEHRLGPLYDYLYFAYPVTGSFEFSVDCYFVRPSTPFVYTPLTYSCVCYGGLVSDRTMMWVVGMQDRIFPESPVPVEKGYLRVTVQVEPERVRFLHNGQLYYEHSGAGRTSPWLALNGVVAHRARFRNLQLSGNPVIPREVHLTHNNRLDGWISSYYFETQPHQPRNAGRRRTLNVMPWAKPEHADWYADHGVIYGRQRNAAPQRGTVQSQLYYQGSELSKFDRVWNDGLLPVQSLLYYHRPMHEGESLSYEFVYEPSKTMVHPAMGRLAFLLGPENVRLHWLTDTPYDDPTGLPHDNVIDVPNERRGPEQLPLKPGEWNRMTVSLAGDTAHLQLNGVEIYQRKLGPSNSRKFGFFHWKDRTTVEVRNVILRGDWPESLTAEQLANLAAPEAGKIAVAQTSRPAKPRLSTEQTEDTASQISQIQNPTPVIWAVAYSPDGSTLATAGGHWSNPGTVKLWDVAGRRELMTFAEPLGTRTVAFSPDGQQLATGNYHGVATLRALPTGKVLAEMRGHGAPINSVVFSPDGAVLATAGADGTIRLWEVPTGKHITTLHGHSDRVYFVVFSPDGNTMLSASKDRTAKLWDIASGELQRTLKHNSIVGCARFSPDGGKIVTVSWDGYVSIWDRATGKMLSTIESRVSSVIGVAVSPDGKTLATGSFGGAVKLWDASTGQEISSLEGHDGNVYGLEFSPDGKTLATGSWDKTTRLWDVETHEQIVVLAPEGDVSQETTLTED